MNSRSSSSRYSRNGFAFKDLLVVAAVTGLLACVLLVEWSKSKGRARGICCNCNLKQVGLAFRTFGLDHSENNPMGLSTNEGGTFEYFDSGETFRHFQRISNELSTPYILVCPSDSRSRLKSFSAGGFSNSNLSYFIGLVSNSDYPQMFLSGDRWLTGGVAHPNRVLEFQTNSAIGWQAGFHGDNGNIGLADGSVQQLNATMLRSALRATGFETNRISQP